MRRLRAVQRGLPDGARSRPDCPFAWAGKRPGCETPWGKPMHRLRLLLLCLPDGLRGHPGCLRRKGRLLRLRQAYLRKPTGGRPSRAGMRRSKRAMFPFSRMLCANCAAGIPQRLPGAPFSHDREGWATAACFPDGKGIGKRRGRVLRPFRHRASQGFPCPLARWIPRLRKAGRFDERDLPRSLYPAG